MIKTLLPLALVSVTLGCATGGRDRNPKFNPGEGAISGKLVDADNDPFDFRLAGEDGAKSLKIQLQNASGPLAATFARDKQPNFVFSHVKPGTYEISLYRQVVGKRTIAGSSPVTVNPDQVTPVVLKLSITPLDDAHP